MVRGYTGATRFLKDARFSGPGRGVFLLSPSRIRLKRRRTLLFGPAIVQAARSRI